MTDSLFQQLKKIGIDDELAHQVSASLDPDHNASKKDVLVLQEAILQVQARTDERYQQSNKHYYELRAESDKRYHELTAESDKRYHQSKAESDKRYHELRTESDKRYHEFKAESDKRYHDIRADADKSYHKLQEAMVNGFSDIRIEFHNRHRHAIYAFGAILVSIFMVLAVNIYFHL